MLVSQHSAWESPPFPPSVPQFGHVISSSTTSPHSGHGSSLLVFASSCPQFGQWSSGPGQEKCRWQMSHQYGPPIHLDKSTGPSNGSKLTPLTAAGVSRRIGMRSSAVFWSSQETRRWTLGRGHSSLLHIGMPVPPNDFLGAVPSCVIHPSPSPFPQSERNLRILCGRLVKT